MAPLPKRRHSSGRQGKRENAIKISLPATMVCVKCGKKRLTHRACRNCGYYETTEVPPLK